MIKEVLGTILFASFSIKTTPLRANENYYHMQGWYNLRDTIEMIDVNSLYFGDFDNPLEFYVYDIDDGAYTKCNVLQMAKQQVSSQWYFSVTCFYYNEDTQEEVYRYQVSIDTSMELTNSETKAQNFNFYVPQTYNIPQTTGNATRFLSWFSQENNDYHRSYTGWYYFSTGSANKKFEIIGSITANNKLYGDLFYEQNWIYVYYPLWLRPNMQEIEIPGQDLYANSRWKIKDKNVYLQIDMMNDYTYNQMSEVGTFAYIPSVTPDQYSFEDLFFNLADTPIYFVYSLFNWKLFGTNLFIAFTGLVSFALLLILFRTFVWKK